MNTDSIRKINDFENNALKADSLKKNGNLNIF